MVPLQNTKDEVLNKSKTIKQQKKNKKKSQYHHQISVENKQNHRPNPIMNIFPETDNLFWQQKTVPGNSTVHTVTTREKAR